MVGGAGVCQGHPHALPILETGMPPAPHPTPNPLVLDGVTSYMNSFSMVSCYAAVGHPGPPDFFIVIGCDACLEKHNVVYKASFNHNPTITAMRH